MQTIPRMLSFIAETKNRTELLIQCNVFKMCEFSHLIGINSQVLMSVADGDPRLLCIMLIGLIYFTRTGEILNT